MLVHGPVTAAMLLLACAAGVVIEPAGTPESWLAGVEPFLQATFLVNRLFEPFETKIPLKLLQLILDYY